MDNSRVVFAICTESGVGYTRIRPEESVAAPGALIGASKVSQVEDCVSATRKPGFESRELAHIEEMSQSYEKPAEVMRWYLGGLLEHARRSAARAITSTTRRWALRTCWAARNASGRPTTSCAAVL